MQSNFAKNIVERNIILTKFSLQYPLRVGFISVYSYETSATLYLWIKQWLLLFFFTERISKQKRKGKREQRGLNEREVKISRNKRRSTWEFHNNKADTLLVAFKIRALLVIKTCASRIRKNVQQSANRF